MPDLGKYAAEVLSAYGLSIALIAGLVLSTWLQSRRVSRALDAAEARRSDG